MLATSRLWRTVVHEIAAEYPDVALDDRLVDACAMQIVRAPASFDVLVTENLFGDILSDEASVLAGSLGMLPSASVGTRRTAHGLHGLYEPIHGSAPDIAGQDLANPIGTILSAAMLLRWSLGRADAADAVEAAVGARARRRLPDGRPLAARPGRGRGLHPRRDRRDGRRDRGPDRERRGGRCGGRRRRPTATSSTPGPTVATAQLLGLL